MKATSQEERIMVGKKRLRVADLEAQAALELPDREMMALVNIILVDT